MLLGRNVVLRGVVRLHRGRRRRPVRFGAGGSAGLDLIARRRLDGECDGGVAVVVERDRRWHERIDRGGFEDLRRAGHEALVETARPQLDLGGIPIRDLDVRGDRLAAGIGRDADVVGALVVVGLERLVGVAPADAWREHPHPGAEPVGAADVALLPADQREATSGHRHRRAAVAGVVGGAHDLRPRPRYAGPGAHHRDCLDVAARHLFVPGDDGRAVRVHRQDGAVRIGRGQRHGRSPLRSIARRAVPDPPQGGADLQAPDHQVVPVLVDRDRRLAPDSAARVDDGGRRAPAVGAGVVAVRPELQALLVDDHGVSVRVDRHRGVTGGLVPHQAADGDRAAPHSRGAAGSADAAAGSAGAGRAAASAAAAGARDAARARRAATSRRCPQPRPRRRRCRSCRQLRSCRRRRPSLRRRPCRRCSWTRLCFRPPSRRRHPSRPARRRRPPCRPAAPIPARGRSRRSSDPAPDRAPVEYDAGSSGVAATRLSLPSNPHAITLTCPETVLLT